jgi:phosphatidylserine decarboxylase
MVKDGIYYALGLLIAAAVLGYFIWWLAIIPVLLACFFLWFFRDPDRNIPSGNGLIVSPADGKVTDVSTVQLNGQPRTRISVFLNVFNVHVNRTPIGGVVKQVQYQKGKFGNAMGAMSSADNEQNIVTVEGEGQTVIFKQIAGLLARRIVFDKKVGDTITRGERIGLIKFGSRVDVILEPSVQVLVKVGDHVAGGSSIIAQSASSVQPGPRT